MRQRHEHGRWSFNCVVYGVHNCKHCGESYYTSPGSKSAFCDPKKIKKMNKENLSWLTTVPASDVNFKGRLKDSDAETIKKALKCKTLSKAARKAMEIRLRKISKNHTDRDAGSIPCR